MGWQTTTKTEAQPSGWNNNGASAAVEPPERIVFSEEPTAPAEPEAIDVAAIMDSEPAEAQPQPEILTGEVQGEAEAAPFMKRRGRRKDPTKEMLKLAKFGEMAVVCHALFYRAMDTPEVPCPPLHPEEAQMIGTAVDGYAAYLIETSPASAPLVPLAALVLANLIPVLNRAPAIVPKTVPFWKKIGEGVSNAWEWIAARFGNAKPAAKPEKKE